MDLYKKVLLEIQDVLLKYPEINSCVCCGHPLKYKVTDTARRRIICDNKTCRGFWVLMPPDYKEWFRAYCIFRSQRKADIRWINQFGNKIKDHLLLDRWYEFDIFNNLTIRHRHGNRFIKKPNKLLIQQKYDEYVLKKKLLNKIDSIDRNIKNGGIDYCKPSKYKLTKINYERQGSISNTR